MTAVRSRSLFVTTALFATLGLGCAEVPTSLLDGDGSGGSGSTQSSTNGTGPGTGSTSSQGGGSGTGGEAPQAATFALSLADATPDLELRATVDIDVTISANGYVGPVALSVTGAPADVTAELASPSVTLSGTGTETVVLTLTTASDTTTGSFPITVEGTVAAGTKTAPATLSVLPRITVYIPVNLASYSSDPADKTAFGAYPTTIKAPPNMSAQNPLTVRFLNMDTTAHEIHADNDTEGFGHSNSPIAPMAYDDDRPVNSPGTYDYYPHDAAIGTSVLGRIVIQ